MEPHELVLSRVGVSGMANGYRWLEATSGIARVTRLKLTDLDGFPHVLMTPRRV